MPPGDLITGDWQVEYNDLLTGDGTDVDLVAITGLEDLPELRGQDYPFAEYHGAYPGRRWMQQRIIRVDYELTGDPAALEAKVRELRRATQPRDDELPLVISLPSRGLIRLEARATRRILPIDLSFLYGSPEASIEWTCSDPVIYSNTLDSTVIPVFTPAGGGFDYPVDYPKDYGGASSGGTVTVPNDGDWPTWPRFVITGPSSGAMNVQRIENVTDGVDIDTTADGGLIVASGKTLVIDTHPARRVVEFTDGASRWNTLTTTDWWEIQPGGAALRLRATGDITGASCTCETRDAY
jgi:hypothetical protein